MDNARNLQTLCRYPFTAHRFHPVSGWCVHGCNTRDDGLTLSRGGSVLTPATPLPLQQPPLDWTQP